MSGSPEIDCRSHACCDALESIGFSPKEGLNLLRADDCDAILPPQLPPTLETRTRRRDSSLLNGIDSSSVTQENQESMEHVRLTKSGFKRKLGVRDADEPSSQRLSEHDDFQYTRLSDTSRSNFKDLGVGKQSPVGRCVSSKPRRQSRKDRTSTRRALEPSMFCQLYSLSLMKLTSHQGVPMSIQPLQQNKSISKSWVCSRKRKKVQGTQNHTTMIQDNHKLYQCYMAKSNRANWELWVLTCKNKISTERSLEYPPKHLPGWTSYHLRRPSHQDHAWDLEIHHNQQISSRQLPWKAF